MSAAITPAELRAYLHLGAADTSRDTELTNTISQAQGKVETMLGYPLATSTVTGEQQDVLPVVIPVKQPAASLTVKYRASLADPLQDVTLTEFVDYMTYSNPQGITRVELDMSRYNLDAIPWAGKKRIILAYSAGWSTIPDTLKLAVTLTAAFLLRLNDPAAPVLDGAAVGDPALKALPAEVRGILQPYLKLRLP